jgi:hypothetical protein
MSWEKLLWLLMLCFLWYRHWSLEFRVNAIESRQKEKEKRCEHDTEFIESDGQLWVQCKTCKDYCWVRPLTEEEKSCEHDCEHGQGPSDIIH